MFDLSRLSYVRPTGAELNSDVMGESTFKTGYYLGLKHVQNNQNITILNPHNRCGLRTWSDGFLWDAFSPD